MNLLRLSFGFRSDRHVGFWHIADIPTALTNVRFRRKSVRIARSLCDAGQDYQKLIRFLGQGRAALNCRVRRAMPVVLPGSDDISTGRRPCGSFSSMSS